MAALSLAALPLSRPAIAHPHIFVDAEIGFVVAEGAVLKTLQVVWRFDAIHTLFALAFDDIELDEKGRLDPEAQAKLIRAYTAWERGFNGFARLSLHGRQIEMEAPSDVFARLTDGRLEIGFSRDLTEPATLSEAAAEIAVYDATYYHAVTVAKTPNIAGEASNCDAVLIPFNPDEQSSTLQAALVQLGREETPANEDLGALFADRIQLSCE